MSRIWRTDGPETKYLERLFRDKIIHANSKPVTVQTKYPIFKDFSAAVFRKNFGLAKDKCCPKPAAASEFDEIPSLLDAINAEEQAMERMDEFDGYAGPPEKKPKLESGEKSKLVFNCDQIPIIPCVFTDPETKTDRCLIVIMLYGGVKGVNVDVVAGADRSEQTLKISYPWPYSMYDMGSMFKDDKNNAMLFDLESPRVQAVENALKNYRDNVADAPLATMDIKLPIEVDVNPDTWKKSYNKKEDGGVILYIELCAVVKNYSINKAEKFLKID